MFLLLCAFYIKLFLQFWLTVLGFLIYLYLFYIIQSKDTDPYLVIKQN